MKKIICLTVLGLILLNQKVHSECEGDLIGYNLPDGGVKCCRKVACSPGHEIKSCSEDGGSDTCKPCAKGLRQFYNITSDINVPCNKHPVCTEESVPCSTSSPHCCCDEERGYTGDDPENCKMHSNNCSSNTYLKDGKCTACPVGTVRPGMGFGRCTPITFVSNVTSGPNVTSSTPATPDSAPGVNQMIYVVVPVLSVVILIAVCVFFCKRRDTSNLFCQNKFSDCIKKIFTCTGSTDIETGQRTPRYDEGAGQDQIEGERESFPLCPLSTGPSIKERSSRITRQSVQLKISTFQPEIITYSKYYKSSREIQHKKGNGRCH